MPRFPARRTATLAATVVALLAGTLAVPTAAFAAAVDLTVEIAPASVSSTPGDLVDVSIDLVNLDLDNDSGPAALVLAITGSTVMSLDTVYGTCDVATLTCVFPDGIFADDSEFVEATVQLRTSGTLKATALLTTTADTDINHANDSLTIPLTVSGTPTPSPSPSPGPTPPAPPGPPAPPVVPVPGSALVSLTATPHPVRAGTPLRLSARLADSSGQPLSGETLTLVRRSFGEAGFSRIAGVVTDLTGAATWDDHPAATSQYQALFAGSANGVVSAGQSAVVGVTAAYAVTALISPVTVPRGSTPALTIVVGSGATGTPVTVQQRLGSSAWRSIGHPLLRAAGTVQMRIRTARGPGTYSFRVIRGADAAHAMGTGLARLVVTNRGKGRATAWSPLYGTKPRPGRWNPCAAIDYFINTRHMPPSGLTDLREALRRVSIASGLTFRYRGQLNVVPTPGYAPRGGILIAWITPAESRGLLRSAADAVTGGARLEGPRIESGFVAVNSDRAARTTPGFGGGRPQGLTLMRALGHVVGLADAHDTWSVMRPGGRLPAAVWSAGDLTGLRAVGRRSGCL